MIKNKQSFFRVKERKVYRKRRKRKNYVKAKHILANRPKEKIKRKKRQRISPHIRRTAVLRLPAHFSFINNPTVVLQSFAKFREHAYDGIDVVLDFEAVKIITPDVIPLLLAKVSKYRRMIRIAGTRPKVKELDELLLECGFYKIVGLTDYKSSKGLVCTHKSKIVDTEVAVSARKLASENTFGDPDKKIQPLYRTLIECMANTRKHAYGDDPHESWWLSVYNNPETKVTSFAFCDTGVGIFKSTKLQTFTKFAVKLGLRSNKDILQMILEGKVESSTGLPYRGKGLPKIFSDYRAKSLKKLYIAANDTFADFDSGTFIELNEELNGTFLYWEISPN